MKGFFISAFLTISIIGNAQNDIIAEKKAILEFLGRDPVLVQDHTASVVRKQIDQVIQVVKNANSSQIQSLLKAGNKTSPVGIHHVSHVPANEQFVSQIMVRNDDSNDSISGAMIFYSQVGELVDIVFDQDGQVHNSGIFSFELPPLGSTLIRVRGIQGGLRSCSMAGLVLDSSNFTDDVVFEVSYTSLVKGQKQAIVGAPANKSTEAFKINVDRTGDQIRGMSIFNTRDLELDCVAGLYNSSGDLIQAASIPLEPYEKWLGLQSDMFPGINSLNGEVGFILFICDDDISVLGLLFEGALLGSVPITRFTL